MGRIHRIDVQPFREPFRATAMRTGLIAIVVGAVVAGMSGGISRWPIATLLALWPSFGGHWVEIWFLNWLRPRVDVGGRWLMLLRVVVWFAGGLVIALGVEVTAMFLVNFPASRWPAWWVGGAAFVGVELVVHGVMQLRRRASFYNGRG